VDTLAFLRTKADRLATLLPKSGILAVIKHIEVGEQHFDRACNDGNADLFADVIYRTNHAFEGILRESYAILAGQDQSSKSAYDIEVYLAESNTFQDRVMELFTNYRKKWRNPSTHNHLATFNEAEAFLALLSVSSFVGMLLNQMIERLAFDQEQERLITRSEKLRESLAKHAAEPFTDRITIALQNFASQDVISTATSEIEVAANLQAFLAAVLPNVQVMREPIFNDNLGSIRPDFLITEGSDCAVIELKRYKSWSPKSHQAVMDQVRRYMDSVGARLGVALVVPTPDAEVTGEQYDKTIAVPLEDDRYLVMIRTLPQKSRKKKSS